MRSAEMVRRTAETGEMLPLLQRHEIQVLLRAGYSQRDVATRLKVWIDTVRRVKRETEVTDVNDLAAHRARGVGRPSKTTEFGEKVRRWLGEDPDLPTQELLRRAKADGYAGNKTAFYALVAGLRPPRSSPIV